MITQKRNLQNKQMPQNQTLQKAIQEMGTALRERRDEKAVRLFLQIQGKTKNPSELEMIAQMKK